MAGGGLIQLVSIGAQDVYLVGNPQITFFKVTYQRHTNFARECIEQTIQGTQGFNQRLTVTISRSGDLVGPMHIEMNLPSLTANLTSLSVTEVYTSASTTPVATSGTGTFNWCWVNYVGYRILKEVTIEIGGQPIDRHFSTWFYMWFELSTPAAKREGLQKMVGGYDITEVPLGLSSNAVTAKTLYVPLVFWFNAHPGLALPLIALQYHEVKLFITTETLNNCVLILNSNTGQTLHSVLDVEFSTPGESGLTHAPIGAASSDLSLSVWADYYYLDSEERRRFAQLSHEYLIKQVQQVSATFSNLAQNTPNLQVDYKTFNHPVSFNVWGFRKTISGSSSVVNADWTNFTNSPPFLQFLGLSVVNKHKLLLNGNDRYNEKDADYYNLVQPYNHFTAIPPTGILTYSYALQPVEQQPSGSLNFSRIDNASNRWSSIPVLSALNNVVPGASSSVWSSSGNVTYEAVVYAVNYNVLRIMSGMGGLAYSN